MQVGTIGLMKAIDRFALERGGELGAYAVPTIVGELRRHLRDHSWPVRAPRGTPAERAPTTTRLEDDELRTTVDALGLDDGERRALVRAGLGALDRRERQIVGLRYFSGLSQRSIARQLGISQVTISRILRSSLAKMRDELGVG